MGLTGNEKEKKREGRKKEGAGGSGCSEGGSKNPEKKMGKEKSGRGSPTVCVGVEGGGRKNEIK